MNSSFANALIGNIFALYGKDYIRIKELREELKVVVVAALVYGETVKEQLDNHDDQISFFKRLLIFLNRHKKKDK